MDTLLEQADQQAKVTRKCPYCAEQIQNEAIKCRFCGEFLNKSNSSKTKWYFTTSTVVIALLCLGPFALPLVWFNPRYKIITRLLVTLAVIVISVLLCYLTMGAYLQLIKQIESLGIN